MRSRIERLLDAPCISLGSWPTPVSAVGRPSRPDVLVKRDDLSGHGRGGVKTRKIEYLVGHMLEKGYDSLITPVGNVTNLVHDILPVLRQFGIAWDIVVADVPPLPLGRRRQIFDSLGDGVRLVGPSHVEAAGALVGAYHRSRRAGHRPFLAPPSLAHPTAVIATARGFLEMVGQVEAMAVPPLRTVFITAASGTAFAGFVLAENMLRQQGHHPIHIVGVQVYPGPARWWIHGLIRWTEQYLAVSDHVPRGRLDLRTSTIHSGFGHCSPAVVELCKSVKDATGLQLDPVFGGKTWSVMESCLAQGRSGGSVLYWHCGYTPDWEMLPVAG
jgi:1-aminocyclopropane-1-carboxylate deaminase/D-cysteine desulfhydrase-like pyridoxal-dependent ACC family enzyme